MKKRILSMALCLVMVFSLLPVGMTAARAADTDTEAEMPLPTLNPVIEGTVRFGSFNYLGDKGTDAAGDERDGVDYVTTFYYSDDFFSRSAVNPNATGKTMDWNDLEDLSMATLSEKFTVAVYGSSENTFPTVWTNKDKNGKRFLTDCGFTNLFTSAEFNQQTGKDTLGYMFGTKQITVWDQKTQQNKTFTLVAVGVRGGGYGAEWGSNLTIGDKSFVSTHNKSYSGTYRHQGFNEGAQKVLTDLRSYTQNMTGDVKYWVVGFSRSGAIANLVAGDITKNASTYKTSIDDVYGYTFEAAAGALKSEDPNGTTYPNIHNIVNPMDAVPRVSPALFNHGRLGVDYRLPFHGNTTSEENTAYYANMRTVLPMVAKIADIYNKSYSGKDNDKYEDAVITDSDPATYPYNRTIQMKSFGITNFNNGFVEDVSNANSKVAPSQGMYLDEFLDSLVPAVINCKAWDAPFFEKRTIGWNADKMKKNDWQSHEKNYVEAYQDSLRDLAYYALKNPGMGLGALDGLMDKALGAVNFQTLFNGVGLAASYAAMHNGIFYETSVGNMIDPLTTIVNAVVDATGLFDSGDLPKVHAAIGKLMPALTWLYCEDHRNMNGEYLGTVFANVGTILVTHIPELGMSWLMSLDELFNSDYREITLPKNAAVNMYEFRAGIDDAYDKNINAEGMNLAAEAQGALVANVLNGALLNSKDARISVKESGDNVIIRYPGNLDLRFDVKAASEDLPVQLADYAPANVVNVKSDCVRATEAANGLNVSNIVSDSIVRDAIDETNMMAPDTTQSAQGINTLSDSTEIPLSEKDTLQIMAWHGSNQVADSYDATYVLNKMVDKTCVIDFSGKMVVSSNATLKEGSTDENGTMEQSGSDVTYQLDSIKQSKSNYAFTAVDHATSYGTYADGKYYFTEKITTVPASSVYYDDNLTGQAFTSDGHGYSSDINDQAVSKSASAVSGTFYYTFYGTGVDAYCTTDSESGYVSAAVFRGSGAAACVKANRVGSAVTVSNRAAEGENTVRYNTPSISFMNLGSADTYTLKIQANDSAKYKLDGVRVYNPVEAGSAAESAQADAGEGNTLYLNLHDLLLNADQGFSVQPVTGMSDDFDKATISGVLFVDNAANLATESHYYIGEGETAEAWHEQAQTLYQTQFAAYQSNSPSNEIYLAAKDGTKTQAITFQVNTQKAPVGSTIYIGMSAPETGSGTVSVPGNSSKDVTSVMDMYYGVTVPENGLITIENVGDSLISLTNLKITNVPESRGIQGMPSADRKSAMRAFFQPVTTETVELAAAPETVTAVPEVTPDPTPDPVQALITQLISDFVNSLFNSVARLFGRL